MRSEVGEVVCEVYAAGAKLVALDGGIGVDGEIPGELKGRVRAHRGELLEAVAGDPLEGPGWDARTALCRRALEWLDGEVEKLGPGGAIRLNAATEALCRQDVSDRLNEAWCAGSFDGFRAALRDYARVGLRAARVEEARSKTGSTAAVTPTGG